MSGPKKSIRTALAQARGLGSAKSGVDHWIMQRFTAVALIPLTIYVLIGFINNAIQGGYSGAMYWLQSPLSASVTILMLLTGLRHAVIGLHVVIEDYVHHEFAKIASLFTIDFFACLLAVLGTLAVAKIFLGV